MQKKPFTELALQAAGLAVGVTIPLLGYLHFSSPSSQTDGFVSSEEYRPGSAAEAVLSHLPQVAILGQKDGPAGTTEVFIQIPGVMNMQSVYVLSDGQTVLSGFVLPKLQATAVPGGQITYPTGNPSLDISAPRQDKEALLAMLRGQQKSIAPPAQAAVEAPKVEPATTAPVAPQLPRTNVELPPPPVPTQSTASIPQPVLGTERVTEYAEPDPVNLANEPKAATPVAQADQMSLLPNEKEFTQLIKDARNNDTDIEAVRVIQEPEGQQKAFLNLVRALPAVSQGQGSRHLYVFFDPNCPACHNYYQQLAADVLAGQVTVHWIPSVVLPSQTSGIAVSAHLIDLVRRGEDMAALTALGRVMRTHGQADMLYAELEQAGNDFREFIPDVVKNTAVMTMAIPETPLIIYENTEGRLVIEDGIPPRGYIANVKESH